MRRGGGKNREVVRVCRHRHSSQCIHRQAVRTVGTESNGQLE